MKVTKTFVSSSVKGQLPKDHKAAFQSSVKATNPVLLSKKIGGLKKEVDDELIKVLEETNKDLIDDKYKLLDYVETLERDKELLQKRCGNYDFSLGISEGNLKLKEIESNVLLKEKEDNDAEIVSLKKDINSLREGIQNQCDFISEIQENLEKTVLEKDLLFGKNRDLSQVNIDLYNRNLRLTTQIEDFESKIVFFENQLKEESNIQSSLNIMLDAKEVNILSLEQKVTSLEFKMQEVLKLGKKQDESFKQEISCLNKELQEKKQLEVTLTRQLETQEQALQTRSQQFLVLQEQNQVLLKEYSDLELFCAELEEDQQQKDIEIIELKEQLNTAKTTPQQLGCPISESDGDSSESKDRGLSFDFDPNNSEQFENYSCAVTQEKKTEDAQIQTENLENKKRIFMKKGVGQKIIRTANRVEKFLNFSRECQLPSCAIF